MILQSPNRGYISLEQLSEWCNDYYFTVNGIMDEFFVQHCSVRLTIISPSRNLSWDIKDAKVNSSGTVYASPNVEIRFFAEHDPRQIDC